MRQPRVVIAGLVALSAIAATARAQPTEPPARQQPPGPALVDGRLNVAGAPADSQTVPAKHSKRNAMFDRLPIAGILLGLSERQKRAIVSCVKRANAPIAAIAAEVTDDLPPSVALHPLPNEAAAELPQLKEHLRDLRYVRLLHRILFVYAPTRTVVGELRKERARTP